MTRVAGRLPGDTPGDRSGECPLCERQVAIDGDGKMLEHTEGHPVACGRWRCAASGESPEQATATVDAIKATVHRRHEARMAR